MSILALSESDVAVEDSLRRVVEIVELRGLSFLIVAQNFLGVISGAGKVLKEHVTADSTEGVNEAQRRLMTPVYTYN